MAWPEFSFQSAFGGVTFDVLDLAGRYGRTVAVSPPSRGDGAFVSDRGRNPESHTWTISISDVPGQSPPGQRRAALLRLIESGEPRTLVHPIDGGLPARLESLEEALVPGSDTFSAVWTEDTETATATGPSEVLASSTLETVLAAADGADAVAEDQPPGTLSPDTAGTRVTAEAWNEEQDRSLERIDADLTRERDSLLAVAASYDTSRDSRTLDLWWATIGLVAELSRYATAVKDPPPSTSLLTIRSPVPLVTLVVSLYGARESSQRIEEVHRLNDIRSGALLPVGTRLLVPRAAA